jgi:hypothetical protein
MAAIVIDPRNIDDSIGSINAAKGDGFNLVGFEVTHPAVKSLLDLNFNRQHEADGDPTVSAVRETLELGVAGQNFVPVFDKTDLDAVAAYCVHVGFEDLDAGRLDQIHRYDTFAQGAASGIDETYDRMAPLGAIMFAVADYRSPIDQRIQWMRNWLQTGSEQGMEKYRAQFEEGFEKVRQAIACGDLSPVVEDGVCMMETDLEVGNLVLQIGYTFASVVCSRLPAQGKVVICQPSLGHTDIDVISARLNALEGGWAGPKGKMCCSPRKDGGTTLSFDVISRIVREETVAYQK